MARTVRTGTASGGKVDSENNERYPGDETDKRHPGGTTAANEEADEQRRDGRTRKLQLVESPEESTNSSSLGRRRSARDRLPPPCSCYSFLGALCSYEHSAPTRVRLLVRSDERTE